MKTKLWTGIILLLALAASAQTNHLAALLQQGLIEEQANRNLDAAIADYQSLTAQFDQDRQVAATAVFRIGECYRMQGRTNEAAAQYERILRDFSDQKTLATMSQENLRGMGVILGQRLEGVLGGNQQGLSPEAQALEIEAQRQLYQNSQGLSPEARALRMEQMQMNHASTLPADDEDREIHRIQELIQNSPDLINAPGNDGKTALTEAAEMGQLKVAAYLLDHGADVNSDSRGTPALIAAASSGNRAMVEFLLGRGADVNAQGPGGKTSLHLAVEKKFQSVTEVLLAHKADVNAQDGNGDTPLTLATRNDPAKIVQMLLAAGANPNLANYNGDTPVPLAALRNSPETLKRLLAAGADPDVADNQGGTALKFAARDGWPELVKMLLAAKADPNGGAPLVAAVEKNGFPAAELLLVAGANPNAKGPISTSLNAGGTFYPDGTLLPPLFLAVSKDELPLVQLLLKFKADPNDLRPYKRSLLFSALSDTNILEALLDAGAKVDPVSPDEWEWTPLGAAAHQNAAGAVAILLKHGANPNVNNRNGARPLHFAAYNRAGPEVFELLLTHGANPNVRSSNGRTPLDELKQLSSDNSNPDQPALLAQLADLLRRHGALDKLPDWNRIEVSRPADKLMVPVFCQGTNDWNHFTLLETILNFYYSAQMYEAIPSPGGGFAWGQAFLVMPFPDLTHVVIVRPSHDSTNETRMTVDLINDTNGIDGSKDVALEFGDVVEIPERDHVLTEQEVGLTQAQRDAIDRLLDGKAQLIVRGQKVELKLSPERAGVLLPDPMGYMEPLMLGVSASGFSEYAGSLLARVLGEPKAQAALLASSDLSRVKVTRHDPKTGRDEVWTVDCTSPHRTAKEDVFWIRDGTALRMDMSRHGGADLTSTDLWLRDGDVIEVPEKP